MPVDHSIQVLQQQLMAALESGAPLAIQGGASKPFIGRRLALDSLDMSAHRGIISYEPSELYITARAGTPLAEINAALAEKRQMLAFEPPLLTEKTSIGGVVATGLSGPRRPYAGSVRDHVLGIRCLNGLAKDLRFGGQVIKNVAGYDLSRLMTGAFGTLGVILEVTLKVMPAPAYEITCRQAMPEAAALAKMRGFSAGALPVSAACYDGAALYVRLSGNRHAVKPALAELGLPEYEAGAVFWERLRDYRADCFMTDAPLWRLSVPPARDLPLAGRQYWIDWGGAQYWVKARAPVDSLFALARQHGGHAMLFKNGGAASDRFQPLSGPLLRLHQALKKAFDPRRILNPGKMYQAI